MNLPPAPLKAACNRSHAKKRAAERYGLDLGLRDLARIEEMILNFDPDAVPLRTAGYESRTLYAVRIEGRWLPVLFDHATDSAMTFLPETVLDPYRSVFDPVVIPEPEPEPEPQQEDRYRGLWAKSKWPPKPAAPKPAAKPTNDAGPSSELLLYLEGVEPLPEVPEDATDEDYVLVIEARKLRHQKLVSAHEMFPLPADRRHTNELIRLNAEDKRSLATRRWERTKNAEISAITDQPGDPLQVLLGIYRTWCGVMMVRDKASTADIDWCVYRAVKECLKLNGLICG